MSKRSSLGQNVGGTEVTSAVLDRDMMICHRNGKTMMNPPTDSTTWAQALLPRRPPREGRALVRELVCASLIVVRASLKAQPPPLDPELDRRQEPDDQHQQDRDRGTRALVVADERFPVEQRDHRLGIALDRVRL